MTVSAPRSEAAPDPVTIGGRPAADVLGFITQCELCGQRVITRAQHDAGYCCPRCAEVADNDPYTAGDCFDHCIGHPDEDNDGPDLRKIRG